MAMYYLAWELDYPDERVERVNRRVERRQLRDTQNTYELPRAEFMQNYRISPEELAMEIVVEMRPYLRRERPNGLAPELKLLVAVNFYATGSFQRATGNAVDLNISQPAVSRAINQVTGLLNEVFLRSWVKFPMSHDEREMAKAKFQDAPQTFEGATGAIDCTVINILAPNDHEEEYVNQHGNHSLNVQAIVDPDLVILNICAKYPGARHDAYIWSVSPVRRSMEIHYNRGERRTWLIGDSGYPLEPKLMTPMPNHAEGTRQHAYTDQHCKARSVVEMFFGVFKSVWRCLLYQRVLMYNPALSGKIVNACAVLHKMMRSHNIQ